MFLKTLQKLCDPEAETCNFSKKETLPLVFFCEFCEIFKNTFFIEHLRATASALQEKSTFHPIHKSLTERPTIDWHISTNVPFLHPLAIWKLKFLGRIEMKHWHKKASTTWYTYYTMELEIPLNEIQAINSLTGIKFTRT